MAGFGDISLNAIVENGVFNQISDYICFCCTKMSDDLVSCQKMLSNDENKLRNYLLENYLDDDYIRRQNGMKMFRFIPEVPENYKGETLLYKGRVDVKILHQEDAFNNREAAYFIECKRLDGKSYLNKEYIENGVKRFVVSPPHYSSYYNKNFMLGLVVSRFDIDKNVEKIELIQEAHEELKNICGFTKRVGKEYQYDSKYLMEDNTIQLCHVFADISESIMK